MSGTCFEKHPEVAMGDNAEMKTDLLKHESDVRNLDPRTFDLEYIWFLMTMTLHELLQSFLVFQIFSQLALLNLRIDSMDVFKNCLYLFIFCRFTKFHWLLFNFHCHKHIT